MGVDVWKLRQPESATAAKTGSMMANTMREKMQEEHIEKPPVISSAADEKIEAFRTSDTEQSNASTHEALSSANVPEIHNTVEEPTAVAAVVIPEESNPDIETSGLIEPAGEVINWHASVSHSSDASSTPWCFVCARSVDDQAVERKLFDAILVALGLNTSDYSLIWAVPVRENEAQPDSGSAVAETLASLLEKERPKNIIVLGEQLAQFLIGTDKPMEVLRTENYRYQGGKSQLFITAGLAHLLSHPLDKANVWQDLMKAKSAII